MIAPAPDSLLDQDLAGFASQGQHVAAMALVEQCAQFKGPGEALAGLQVKAAPIAAISFEPGWVCLPLAGLRDLPAGPMGRLGMALMGAAAERSREQKAPPRASSVGPQAVVSAIASSSAKGNGAWLDEAPAETKETWVDRSGSQTPRPRRVFAEEGEGENSFDYLVRQLEDSGFGGTSNALVAANRAKAKARPRF